MDFKRKKSIKKHSTLGMAKNELNKVKTEKKVISVSQK